MDKMETIERVGRDRWGDKWDPSDLRAASHFARYYDDRATRIKVVGPWGERTGYVGRTTGWKPAFLLIYRSNASGSPDLLGPEDRIVAVWNGRKYVPVAS